MILGSFGVLNRSFGVLNVSDKPKVAGIESVTQDNLEDLINSAFLSVMKENLEVLQEKESASQLKIEANFREMLGGNKNMMEKREVKIQFEADDKKATADLNSRLKLMMTLLGSN